ncbi:MAG: methylenetetrahydrofolate--tRNA-(uracil(54)-C(5))-methyltransferase (FADH(2)-oxidizing) TrmFO [Clostridia bacterium]|nr:methylenetetrahydrofolate--tRNA-(uracil(54)-C(5))-methyltransferase (FADH(2)-oxidizing) TrmFO [Clostridia bacterium]
MKDKFVKIIGGGLAGCECALQLLRRGYAVRMYEMRPNVKTGAHKTEKLAELVCSNSLKSCEQSTASGLLKDELEYLGCALLPLARECAVPSGSALAVDREEFSSAVERELAKYENFELVREEVHSLDDVPTVIATGPLTSPDMAETVGKLTGKDRLFFYDAIAPIVSFESVDMNFAYFGGRYGKGGEDYLNLPMQKDEYEAFYRELVDAKTVVLHDFEKEELFDGCMPIEEMAKRGSDTIRFGPLKPIGLRNPKTGEKAYAVVQLRKENVAGDCYNLVGFQTNLTYPEQKRVFSMIPALHDAEFVRYGVMHRNTYINSPNVLDKNFRLIGEKPLYIAGQLSGVEGYVESIMSGMIAGISMAYELEGRLFEVPSGVTIIGSLARYVSTRQLDFKPMNANFGILPQIDGIRDKQKRKLAYHDRAIESLKAQYGAQKP